MCTDISTYTIYFENLWKKLIALEVIVDHKKKTHKY